LAGRGIEDERVVDEHEHGLAADIDALVVIPAILGGDDAVADEDEVGVFHVDGGRDAAGERDVVEGAGGGEGLAADGEGGGSLRGDADHGDVLQEGAVGVAGLEAEGTEFALEVGDGFFFAGRGGRAAFEFIGGDDGGAGFEAGGGNLGRRFGGGGGARGGEGEEDGEGGNDGEGEKARGGEGEAHGKKGIGRRTKVQGPRTKCARVGLGRAWTVSEPGSGEDGGRGGWADAAVELGRGGAEDDVGGVAAGAAFEGPDVGGIEGEEFVVGLRENFEAGAVADADVEVAVEAEDEDGDVFAFVAAGEGGDGGTRRGAQRSSRPCGSRAKRIRARSRGGFPG
jgi:hypothetical protein